jgi:hypothetical protein
MSALSCAIKISIESDLLAFMVACSMFSAVEVAVGMVVVNWMRLVVEVAVVRLLMKFGLG